MLGQYLAYHFLKVYELLQLFTPLPRSVRKHCDTLYDLKQAPLSEPIISLSTILTHQNFVCHFIWHKHHITEEQSSGNFLLKLLRFSSILVKLQKRSQQETSELSYQSATAILPACLSTLLPCVIGIIVRLRAGNKLGVLWRARAVSLKGRVSGGAPRDASMSERQLV